MEKEIIKFHNQQAEIANLERSLKKMQKSIVEKFCPFKKGDKVIYTEGWRKDGKDYFGVIAQIYFRGIDSAAINSRWIIQVIPTTKDFKDRSGSPNKTCPYFPCLGKHKGDKVRKAQH